MRTSQITTYDAKARRFGRETISIILGPPDDEDGTFLVQREDGSFWNYTGSPAKGWFGGSPAKWEAKK